MDRLIDALTALIENPEAFKGKRPAVAREIVPAVSGAPASVQRLAAALSARYYNVNLGELRMFESNDDGQVASLAETLSMAAENGGLDLAAVLPAGFDPDQTLLLGADGGGMSYFGLAWSDDAASFVVVEYEDPTEDNLLKVFTTPAAFLAFLDEKRDQEPASADLETLRAAQG